MFPKTGKGPYGMGVGNWIERVTATSGFTPIKGQLVTFDIAHAGSSTTNDEDTEGNGFSVVRAIITADSTGATVLPIRAIVLDDPIPGKSFRVLVKGRGMALVGTSNSSTSAVAIAGGWLAARNGKTYLDVVPAGTGSYKPAVSLGALSGLANDVPVLTEVLFDGFNSFGVF